MEMLSGGDMLIRALHDEGVDLIFGYPGGAALHIYDAIFNQDKVEHILVRHEQAATHAADGYASQLANPVSCSSLPVRELPMLLPVLRRPIWIPFPW